ncbi:MAG: hypothetical protein ACI376_08880 [Candidatus Bruticola sp.]
MRKICGSILIFLIMILGVGELYLRHNSYPMPGQNTLHIKHIDDRDCGWLPAPGTSYSKEDPQASATVLSNFCRVSLSPEASKRNSLSEQNSKAVHPLPALILGCSYTFGMGVKDKDTFCWRLNDSQQRFNFTNCGVIGYSTYQCLKRLEKMFAAGERPRLVIYAFINDHLMRNVSCRIFGKTAEAFDFIETPYFELQPSDNFIFHPLRHLSWPGEQYLYTVNFANRLYINRLIDRSRRINFNKEAAQALYRHLIGEMEQLCRRHGAILAVASLDTSSNWLTAAPNKYDSIWQNSGDRESDKLPDSSIHFIDANCEQLYLPEYHVMNRLDFHPAPVAHKFWADKINGFIQQTNLN